MSFILQESVNTIDFRNVAMDKFIEDDPKVFQSKSLPKGHV